MPIRNQNWYDLQGSRRYPLDDRSTGLDDAGQTIRDSILVDCHLRFPNTLGQYAYVQGITIAPRLITVVFGAVSDLNDTSPVTIAAVSLPRTAAQNVNHEIIPLADGVAGWIVLGAGLTEEFTGRYSSPLQTLIAPRNARAYRPLPIPNIGKVDLAASLQGIITFTGQSPVVVAEQLVDVDGIPTPALVFSLDGSLGADNQSELQRYLGPCAQRPESGTCPKPVIQTINGLSPDCNGNINLAMAGFTAYPFSGGGGVDIISATGLADACGNNTTVPTPTPAVDKCGEGWSDPLTDLVPTIISSESLPELDLPSTCLTLPVCFNFGAGGEAHFQVLDGMFMLRNTLSPPIICTGGTTEISRTTYAATDIAGKNFLMLKNCEADWAREHQISTRMKMTAEGLRRNGGIFFNYVQDGYGSGATRTFFLAQLDGSSGQVRLLRWNGSRFVTEHHAAVTLQIGAWYDLEVQLHNTGSATSVTVNVVDVAGNAESVSISSSFNSTTYGSPLGQVGLFTDSAYTYFNSFWIYYLPIE
jgi:hypothetical protein